MSRANKRNLYHKYLKKRRLHVADAFFMRRRKSHLWWKWRVLIKQEYSAENYFWRCAPTNVKNHFSDKGWSFHPQSNKSVPGGRRIYRIWGRWSVHVDGEAVALTTREFEILRFLLENQNKVITRETLMDSIWAKTFISMLVLLVACCILIYGMVMIFLPKNYQSEL